MFCFEVFKDLSHELNALIDILDTLAFIFKVLKLCVLGMPGFDLIDTWTDVRYCYKLFVQCKTDISSEILRTSSGT